ncbi:hypothetical protein [Natranaeroarchaeum sulfidigenes]|uniref:Uncharacterized protein n=1 Tax=Natranaeroarchaeum sulfidigenes TaxID=2784880 RepID=A0A897ML32_9EURY|nr:hypothetical protein [Natranaeroarchaeum sulfidigenes]QSG02870.1 hypothetical protein AArcS_1660 [Natranaeroarchaeum sulfidigenes]
MVSNTSHSGANRDSQLTALDFDEYTASELESLLDDLTEELDRRAHDTDLAEAERVNLVNGQFVSWVTLSAHANSKAVKPWILRVTDTHDKYGVDGDWLSKQKIDGTTHMDITPVSEGDIIKVSGASHNNKKHRYYRVVAVTDDALYYEPQYGGLSEATVIEEVG